VNLKAFAVNIKTTGMGLAAAIIALVSIFVDVTPEQSKVIESSIILLISLGLITARDADKSSEESK
jgi:hypothetical protein